MNVQTGTTSTLPQEQVPAEARVILKRVSWSTFKALMADIGEDRSCRIAYNQGMLEIMVPYEQLSIFKMNLKSGAKTSICQMIHHQI